MKVHYLEIVTPNVFEVCRSYEAAMDIEFGGPEPVTWRRTNGGAAGRWVDRSSRSFAGDGRSDYSSILVG